MTNSTKKIFFPVIRTESLLTNVSLVRLSQLIFVFKANRELNSQSNVECVRIESDVVKLFLMARAAPALTANLISYQ